MDDIENIQSALSGRQHVSNLQINKWKYKLFNI